MRNSKYRITVQIDDANGTIRSPRDAYDFAGTIGADRGDQWGARYRPHVEVTDVEPVESQRSQRFEQRRQGLRDEALVQIQNIAYDGGILGEEAEADEQIEGHGADAVRALTAKLQRVCGIAEGCEPDEDWRPLLDHGIRTPEAGEKAPTGCVEVYTAEVAGREEGLYLFADAGFRNAFATAVESEGGVAIRGMKVVNGEDSTKALVASEVRTEQSSARRFLVAATLNVEADDLVHARTVLQKFCEKAETLGMGSIAIDAVVSVGADEPSAE